MTTKMPRFNPQVKGIIISEVAHQKEARVSVGVRVCPSVGTAKFGCVCRRILSVLTTYQGCDSPTCNSTVQHRWPCIRLQCPFCQHTPWGSIIDQRLPVLITTHSFHTTLPSGEFLPAVGQHPSITDPLNCTISPATPSKSQSVAARTRVILIALILILIRLAQCSISTSWTCA